MKRLLEQINQAEKVVLLPHIHADGDALGSCYALAEIVRQMGKTAVVLLEEVPPAKFDYLPGTFQVFQGIPETYDLAVAVDCSDLTRLGKRSVLYCGKTACIDHHRTDCPIGQLAYVDESAAATAELVYQLTQEAGMMNREIGVCLYTALVTDTGCFRYSNTTPSTMRIGAELMELGIDTSRIQRRLYEQVSLGNLKFQGECIQNMRLFSDRRIAVTFLTEKRSQELELTSDDTEGGGSMMLSVAGVDVGAFFHERQSGIFKVSLRSNESADVSEIAKCFGGGGHLRASGYTTEMPLEQAIAELVKKTKEQLRKL